MERRRCMSERILINHFHIREEVTICIAVKLHDESADSSFPPLLSFSRGLRDLTAGKDDRQDSQVLDSLPLQRIVRHCHLPRGIVPRRFSGQCKRPQALRYGTLPEPE